MTCFFPKESVLSLEKSMYQVTEGVGMVEVCARVVSPSGVCPINLTTPFSLRISTTEDTAGSTYI